MKGKVGVTKEKKVKCYQLLL